jgi:hypothetical protein
LIRRDGYHTSVVGIEDGKCRNCNAKVDVVLD